MSVVNLRAYPGWEQDPNGVYIGRAGHGQDGYFGNPIPRKQGMSPGSTLPEYQDYLDDRVATDIEFRQRVHGLYGKTLYCFCKPAPCHGDRLERRSNELQGDIFCDSADVHVITTNQKGVMGRGLARQCKTLYPEVFARYLDACRKGTHTPDNGLAVRVANNKIIFLTPTKNDPREDSRLEDVEQCILDIKRRMEVKPELTVALPPLGCGLGRLPVQKVREIVERELDMSRLHLVGGW